MASWTDANQELDRLREKINQLSAKISSESHEDFMQFEEANEQLQVLLEELSVADEELTLQNEELLQARAAIERERERYQDLFEFAPDGYLLTDRHGKILEANRAAALLVNVPQENLQMKMLAQFIVPEERKAFRLRLAKFQTAQEDALEAYRASPAERRAFQRLAEDWEVSLQPLHGPPFDAVLGAAIYLNGQESLLRWSIHDITRRKATQKALRSSERKFKILADITSVAIFLVRDGRITYANPAAALTTGYPADELIGKEFLSFIHTDDRHRPLAEQWARIGVEQAAVSAARMHGRLRLLTPSGEDCWVELSFGSTELDDEQYWVISAFDVTPAIRADRAQKDLLRWLVTAQEDERRRIARELHDQTGQELTALTLGLKSLEQEVEEKGSGLGRLKQLQRIAYELGEEVHRVAFDLRPTSLDDLGLRYSLNNYIEEWSERSGIRVEFETTGLKDGTIPPAIATTVFRIVQEALNNVLKHSGASRVSMIFDHRPGEVRVIVEDNGCGFNAETIQKSLEGVRRLGLLGMQERAELVGGAFVVESEAGKGTTVYVNIPLLESDHGKATPTEERAENGSSPAADLPG